MFCSGLQCSAGTYRLVRCDKGVSFQWSGTTFSGTDVSHLQVPLMTSATSMVSFCAVVQAEIN